MNRLTDPDAHLDGLRHAVIVADRNVARVGPMVTVPFTLCPANPSMAFYPGVEIRRGEAARLMRTTLTPGGIGLRGFTACPQGRAFERFDGPPVIDRDHPIEALGENGHCSLTVVATSNKGARVQHLRHGGAWTPAHPESLRHG